jgi:hypothetical protein
MAKYGHYTTAHRCLLASIIWKCSDKRHKLVYKIHICIHTCTKPTESQGGHTTAHHWIISEPPECITHPVTFLQVHLNRPICVPSTPRSFHVIYYIQAPRLNFCINFSRPLGYHMYHSSHLPWFIALIICHHHHRHHHHGLGHAWSVPSSLKSMLVSLS